MRSSDIPFDADVKNGNIVCAYIGRYPSPGVDFDIGKDILERHGYQIISLEEAANLRVKENRVAPICGSTFIVKEGAVYLPSGEVYITKNSPIMSLEKDFPIREGKLKLSEEQVAYALEDAVQLDVSNLNRTLRIRIPTREFGNEPVTDFLFGDGAKEYGNLLYTHHDYERLIGQPELGFELFGVYVERDSYKTPIATQIHLGSIFAGSNSPILCNFGLKNDQIRGIRYDGKTGLDPVGVLVNRELDDFKFIKEVKNGRR